MEKQLRLLADVHEICNLKAVYARSLDHMTQPHYPEDQLALERLFDETATADLGPGLRFADRAAIMMRFTKTVPRSRDWYFHVLSNPIVRVDGDRARGEWSVQTFITEKGAVPGSFKQGFGRYKDEFVRRTDGWRITRLEFHSEAP